MFNFGNKKIELLAIGDIATDTFIGISEAETKCDGLGDHCELCLKYGGKIPYDQSEICYAAGNSSNVAIALSRLGVKTSLLSNIGDDEDGKKCLLKLKNEKVDTQFIIQEEDKPTNRHYVLWYGPERTILTKHEKYTYQMVDDKILSKILSDGWIYLSSLGEDSDNLYKEILEYLNSNNNVKLAFQPGTFQIKLEKDKLKGIYQKTEIFLSNKDEAKRILDTEENDIGKLLKMIKSLGPKIVVITDGQAGAYALDDSEMYFVESLPQSSVESTGAGDAFSGAFVCARMLGKDINESLLWGSINAKSVIAHIGPHKGLLNKKEIEKELNSILNN